MKPYHVTQCQAVMLTVATIALLGILTVQILTIAGVGASPAASMMARAQHMLKDYPADQLATTLRQTISTIENLHQISARAHMLTKNIEPGQLERVVQQLDTLNAHQVAGFVENANRLMSGMKSESVEGVASNMKRITEQLDVERLNHFMQAVGDLKEIKISL